LAEAKFGLTRPYPGGLGSEAALVMDRDRDRNRGGTEQDEFYHGKISIVDPSVQAIFMPNSGIPLHVPEQTNPP
jgi:hypothetical protein